MDWAELNNNWYPGEPNNNRGAWSSEDKLEIFKVLRPGNPKSFGLNDTPNISFYKSFVCKMPCIQIIINQL